MCDDDNTLNVSVKVGKSYKNRGWALNRASTYELIPILPYEEECDIIVDGIHAKAHFNLLPRIFYSKTEKDLMAHLKKLADNSVDRVELKMLLNKHDDNIFNSISDNSNEKYIIELEKKLKVNENLLTNIQRENINLLNELESYKSENLLIDDLLSKIKSLEEHNKKLSDELESSSSTISTDENQLIEHLHQEIADLNDKNIELEIEFAKLLKKWNSEKKSREIMREIKSRLDEMDL